MQRDLSKAKVSVRFIKMSVYQLIRSKKNCPSYRAVRFTPSKVLTVLQRLYQYAFIIKDKKEQREKTASSIHKIVIP